MKIIFFCFISLSGFAQFKDHVRVQLFGISRNQELRVDDTGGYFIGDQYTRRLNFGAHFLWEFTERWAIMAGVQRVSFINDSNFWFRNNDPVLLVRTNPFNGPAFVTGIDKTFIKYNRWRIGVQGRYQFALIKPGGGSSSGGNINPAQTIQIDYNSITSVKKRNFHALGFTVFTHYKLSSLLSLVYEYGYMHALNEAAVVAVDVNYTVTSGGNIQTYSAQTRATGTASSHSVGFQFTF
ncbi:MAG: hypothetical protein KF763_01275 [Cyclobacteriaceae bacterium]|nr:hypothetical protein [Cyclobacteriaceae bacterium]